MNLLIVGGVAGGASAAARARRLSDAAHIVLFERGWDVSFAKCASPDKEQAKVDLLLKTVIELPFDQAAAREAGRIRGLLESQGGMIGPYDILLAAQALAAGLTLVTANTGEFQGVPEEGKRGIRTTHALQHL